MISYRSVGGNQYFVVIVDEYSRFFQAIQICQKIEASSKVLEFVRCFEIHSGHPVRSLYTNGGTEFSNFRRTLQEKVVDVKESTPYTPQSNGLLERQVGTVMTAARATLIKAKFPMTY